MIESAFLTHYHIVFFQVCSFRSAVVYLYQDDPVAWHRERGSKDHLLTCCKVEMELEGQAAGARLGLSTGGPRLEDMQETFQIIAPWRWRSELRKGLRGEGQCEAFHCLPSH